MLTSLSGGDTFEYTAGTVTPIQLKPGNDALDAMKPGNDKRT